METWFRCFRDVERSHVDFIVRRVDQTEGSQIIRGRGRSRKTIKKNPEHNVLDRDMVMIDFRLKLLMPNSS